MNTNNRSSLIIKTFIACVALMNVMSALGSDRPFVRKIADTLSLHDINPFPWADKISRESDPLIVLAQTTLKLGYNKIKPETSLDICNRALANGMLSIFNIYHLSIDQQHVFLKKISHDYLKNNKIHELDYFLIEEFIEQLPIDQQHRFCKKILEYYLKNNKIHKINFYLLYYSIMHLPENIQAQFARDALRQISANYNQYCLFRDLIKKISLI